MNRTTRLVCGTFTAVALALGATGCSSDDDDDVIVVTPDRTGFLTTQWSIDGSIATSRCRVYGAYDFELVIYDDLGGFYSEDHAPCEAFGLTVELPVGTWSADATLVDADDFAVSLTQVLDDLLILEGSELVVDIDYPPDMILTSAAARAE